MILRPGSMPAMLRRPSQTTSSGAEPSNSSASSAGTPARGRRVTVRSVPVTVTTSRSRQSWIRSTADLRGVLEQLLGVQVLLGGGKAAEHPAESAGRAVRTGGSAHTGSVPVRPGNPVMFDASSSNR